MGKKLVNGYWTFERCRDEAKRYSTVGDFRKNSGSAYTVSHTSGWFQLITTHMSRSGGNKNRYVYKIQLNRTVYIGLSYDPIRRLKQHKVCGPVKNILDKGATFLIVSKCVSAEQAAVMESELLIAYRLMGFQTLNSVKAGGLGCGSSKWTFEKCKSLALLFHRQAEFKKKFNGAYQAAYKNGWLSEICEHMTIRRKHNSYWNLDRILHVALKCKTRAEFRLTPAYGAAQKRRLLNEVTFNEGNVTPCLR